MYITLSDGYGTSDKILKDNEVRLNKQAKTTICDVEGDVCCEYVLLSLVNKEVASGQWPNRVKAG